MRPLPNSFRTHVGRSERSDSSDRSGVRCRVGLCRLVGLLGTASLLVPLAMPPVRAAAPAPSKEAPRATLRLAAASDLQAVLPRLAESFERARKDTTLSFSFQASGSLAAQIRQGAPFDLFLSADRALVDALEKDGLGLKGTKSVYAVGRLAAFIPAKATYALDGAKADLLGNIARLAAKREIKSIVIGNPEHAPYGRAAREALESAHVPLTSAVPKLILAESVAMVAFQTLQAKDAVGITSHSLALSGALKEKGRSIEIPESAHRPIEQACVALRRTEHEAAARAFVDFLRTETARRILVASGYDVPTMD